MQSLQRKPHIQRDVSSGTSLVEGASDAASADLAGGYEVQKAQLSPSAQPSVQQQRDALRPGKSTGDVQAAAARGTAGGGGELPHLAAIQASFGRHDVSGVKAHVGGVAAGACADMGAQAYASGDSVAFASAPDLHLAAHEAAHVVQQRGGVSLKGGVGQAGDAYEQHADAVADRVVQGKSAEGLLDPYAGGGGGGGVQRAVQREEAPTSQQLDAEKEAVNELQQAYVDKWLALPKAQRDAVVASTHFSIDGWSDRSRLPQGLTCPESLWEAIFIEAERQRVIAETYVPVEHDGVTYLMSPEEHAQFLRDAVKAYWKVSSSLVYRASSARTLYTYLATDKDEHGFWTTVTNGWWTPLPDEGLISSAEIAAAAIKRASEGSDITALIDAIKRGEEVIDQGYGAIRQYQQDVISNAGAWATTMGIVKSASFTFVCAIGGPVTQAAGWGALKGGAILGCGTALLGSIGNEIGEYGAGIDDGIVRELIRDGAMGALGGALGGGLLDKFAGPASSIIAEKLGGVIAAETIKNMLNGSLSNAIQGAVVDLATMYDPWETDPPGWDTFCTNLATNLIAGALGSAIKTEYEGGEWPIRDIAKFEVLQTRLQAYGIALVAIGGSEALAPR